MSGFFGFLFLLLILFGPLWLLFKLVFGVVKFAFKLTFWAVEGAIMLVAFLLGGGLLAALGLALVANLVAIPCFLFCRRI